MLPRFFRDRAQFLIRQSGILALVALLFAVTQAARVISALCHGVGLHGAYLETYTGKTYVVLLPMWDTFLQAITAAVVGSVFLLIAVQNQKRARSNMRFSRRPTEYTRRH